MRPEDYTLKDAEKLIDACRDKLEMLSELFDILSYPNKPRKKKVDINLLGLGMKEICTDMFRQMEEAHEIVDHLQG
jgi:hypothetical protein